MPVLTKFAKAINKPITAEEIKSGNQFTQKLYFSPKNRHEIKQSFLKLKQTLEKCWNMSDEELKEQSLTREVMISLTGSTAGMLRIIRQAEEWSALRRMKERMVDLYQHKTGPKQLLEFNFYRVVSAKRETASWLLPEGLPRNRPVKAVIYKRRLNKQGYRLVDSGVMFQKILNMHQGQYTLRFRKKPIKLAIEGVS